MPEPTSSPAAGQSRPALAILGLLVVMSAVLRSVFAWQHAIPRLFPDEYIYAALGRSIGHGNLEIRGAAVHFPGLLEPIFAAPLWRLFSITTAYHLVQVENALAVSLAAIPVYLLARSLRLGQRFSLAAAAYALLIPELVLVAYTSSDAIAYPFALSAAAIGVASLDRPTSRRQVAFVLCAGLATLARAEYFALVPAYVVAAVAIDHRAAWRRHKVALFALVPLSGLAALFAFGYYLTGAPSHATPLHTHYVSWFFVQLFLVAIELGVAIVPGVVAGLLRPRTRQELAFAAFFGALSILILVAATKPGAEKLEFKERYLFLLLALAPLAYGLYVRRSRPYRAIVIGIAAAIAIAAARLPLTEYSAATFKTDSQFLFAIYESQTWLGGGNSSLVVALIATLAALAAVVVSLRDHASIPLGFAIVVALSATIVATHVDLRTTRSVRSQLPPDLSWVDHIATGPVTAVETPLAVKQDLLYVLYWNTSIGRENLLGAAHATDTFSAPRLRIGDNGTLDGVRGDILFHSYGATGRLTDAKPLARYGHFTLWRSQGPARFGLIIEGRFWDAWLSTAGRLRAWPQHPGAGAGVRVRFRLSLPRDQPKIARMRLGGTTFAVRPGGSVNVVCASGRGRLDVPFSGTTTRITEDFRFLSARLTRIVTSDHPGTTPHPRTCSLATQKA
jgi:hypothetical protein